MAQEINTIEEMIQYLFENDAGVDAYVENRIYHPYPSQNALKGSAPFILYTLSDNQEFQHMLGGSGLQVAEFNINSVSKRSYSEAKNIDEAVKTLLLGLTTSYQDIDIKRFFYRGRGTDVVNAEDGGDRPVIVIPSLYEVFYQVTESS